MILASRAASRAVLAACAATLLALLVALPGCGGDTPATAGGAEAEVTATVTKTKLATERAGVGELCRRQVGAFLTAMDTLRERLVNGMSYEEYVGEIDALRAVYDDVPVNDLKLGCLANAGTPGEQAFGRYIEAANAWGACIDESGCDAATVEPVLQELWKGASQLLDQAQAGLRA